jgi:hypothetical protein
MGVFYWPDMQEPCTLAATTTCGGFAGPPCLSACLLVSGINEHFSPTHIGNLRVGEGSIHKKDNHFDSYNTGSSWLVNEHYW